MNAPTFSFNPSPDGLLLLCSLVAVIIGVFGLAALIGHHRRFRDPQRLFTYRQKQLLIVQAGWRCEHKPVLSRRCSAAGTEADHVVPWSKGGPTQLWNGQLLCRRHNKHKSNGMPSHFYRWRLRRRRRRYATAASLHEPAIHR